MTDTELEYKYRKFVLLRSQLLLFTGLLFAAAIFGVNHEIIFSEQFVLSENWVPLIAFNSSMLATFCYLIKQSEASTKPQILKDGLHTDDNIPSPRTSKKFAFKHFSEKFESIDKEKRPKESLGGLVNNSQT